MKIIFNSMNCGLGNNGGSQTIVKSANTLIDLGHDVSIIDTGKNKHTWNELKANHIILKHINDCPSCDIIIGTGIKTLHKTSICKTAKKKFHWIRGWETWQVSPKQMLNMFYTNQNEVNLVTNGAGIQKILRKNNVKSKIQLAGLDIPKIKYVSTKKADNTLTIGGLINTKHKTKQSEYLYHIFSYLSIILNSSIQVRLMTFGAEGVKRKVFNNHFHISHPDNEKKNNIYDNVDFWISSSINEGFHIPPAEFMLRNNGVVVGVDHPLNGTKHYLKNKETGYTCENNWKQIADLIINKMNNNIELDMLSNSAYYKITDDIGSREKNMKKFVKLMETL